MSKDKCVNLDEVISKIDISRLSRDFEKYPLNVKKHNIYSEQILYSDLYYLYIELNLTRNEIAQYLNISVALIKKILKKYKLIKPKLQISLNILRIKNDKYGNPTYNNPEKYKETCLQNFGYTSFMKTNEFKEKSRQTLLERFGVENYTQSEEYKKLYENEEWVDHKVSKRFQTAKANDSFKKSKPEEEIYILLLTKFDIVLRDYESKEYPFPCDFYIPELDLYIEYQGYWTHGRKPYHEPFDSLNINHLNILEKWKLKGTRQFQKAIKTWTILDPLKRTVAKKNKLNWIEFFNMKQFMEWFNQL